MPRKWADIAHRSVRCGKRSCSFGRHRDHILQWRGAESCPGVVGGRGRCPSTAKGMVSDGVCFQPQYGRRAEIDELFAKSFPHFKGLIVPFEAGQEVVGEGDPTESYYLVMRGMFRAVKFTRDGRRQVFAFYMPGDICGLEPEAVHKLTIEAMDSAAMAVLPRPHAGSDER